MEKDATLITWIGEQVILELRDVMPSGPGGASSLNFEKHVGTLQDVSELGVVFRGVPESEEVTFYPWSVVRRISMR